MPFVYSTATCDNIFPVYEENKEPGKAHSIKHSVPIKGGANLAKGKGEFVTKYGIRTEVSDSDLALLKENAEFMRMVKDGFMFIDERKRNAEEVASDMEARDESAPLVPQDYEPIDKDADEMRAAPKDAGEAKAVGHVAEVEEEDED